MRTRRLALLVLILTAPLHPAAQFPHLKEFRPVEGPLTRVHYDLATGVATRLGQRGVQAVDAVGVGLQRALANCFSNTLTTGYSLGLTNGWEFIDYARKDCGTSGLIGKFGFAYATMARDVNDVPPGPGASLGIRLYQGGSPFCGSAGTLAGDFLFAGLPAALGTQVNPGFMVTATLPAGSPVSLADGPISWGYSGNEGPQGTPGQTGPLLTEFSVNTGWMNVFDIYNRTPNSVGTCVVSFFFGCSSPVPPPPSGSPCAGFWLQLWEQGSKASAATARTCGTNPNVFAHVGSDADGDSVADAGPAGPVIGETWISTVAAPLSLVSIFSAPLSGAPLGGIFGGSFLCGTRRLATDVDLGTHRVPIPADLTLLGAALTAQGATLALGPIQVGLTNALDIVLGAR